MNITDLIEALEAAIEVAPPANYEESDYNAGYVAGLDYARRIAEAIK
jgi:hypothetical protein